MLWPGTLGASRPPLSSPHCLTSSSHSSTTARVSLLSSKSNHASLCYEMAHRHHCTCGPRPCLPLATLSMGLGTRHTCLSQCLRYAGLFTPRLNLSCPSATSSPGQLCFPGPQLSFQASASDIFPCPGWVWPPLQPHTCLPLYTCCSTCFEADCLLLFPFPR